jgi:Ca2+-transporting ATPase
MFIICFGVIVGVAMMAFQAISVNDQWHWQTALFTALIFSRLSIALSGRSDTETVFTIGILRNRFMIASILITIALQMLIIYIPAMNIVFKTQPLTLFELGVSAAFAMGVFIMLEIWKKIRA